MPVAERQEGGPLVMPVLASASDNATKPAGEAGTRDVGDLGSKTWSLQQQRGKVVVVNYFATWCPPSCVAEMPDLLKIAQEYSGALE